MSSTYKCPKISTVSVHRLATSAPCAAATALSQAHLEGVLPSNRPTAKEERTQALPVSPTLFSLRLLLLKQSHPRIVFFHIVVVDGPRTEVSSGVKSAKTLETIQAQALQNQQDLDVAIAANQAAGAVGGNAGASAISGAWRIFFFVFEKMVNGRLTC